MTNEVGLGIRWLGIPFCFTMADKMIEIFEHVGRNLASASNETDANTNTVVLISN